MNALTLRRPIRTWDELTERQHLFEATKKEWVFRGVSDARWDLETSLDRVASEFDVQDADEKRNLETTLILEFARRYHLYAAEPPPRRGDTLDWLALMRHYGAPVRLLDFTFSFPIAAYFALEDSPPRRRQPNRAIYAVNKSWLTGLVQKWADRTGSEEVGILRRLGTLRDGTAFRKLFMERDLPLVSALSPFRLNQRLTIQKGIFLCSGTLSQPLHRTLQSLDKDRHKEVVKIEIVPDMTEDMLRRLEEVGLNRASLFPGLDGYAQSLRTRIPLFLKLRQMEKDGARTEYNIGPEMLNRI